MIFHSSFSCEVRARLANSFSGVCPGVLRASILWFLHFTLRTLLHFWPHTGLTDSPAGAPPSVLRESILWLLHFTPLTLLHFWPHTRLTNSVAGVNPGVL